MSNETNTWRKRTTQALTCPSGNRIIIRRSGPELALKSGKIARIFQKQTKDDLSDVNKQLQFIENLPDEELNKLMGFARVLVSDVVIDPPLSLHPKEGQLGPDDVPLADFWYIFTWAMNGGPDMPVQLAEGETSVDAVDNFPSGQEPGSPLGEDSEIVQ